MLAFVQLAQVAVAGLTNGAIYALVALGFSLVFSVSGFLNLVQGEFVVISGLVTIGLNQWLGLPLIPSIILAVMACCLIGLLFQQLTLAPSRHLSADAALMVTVGGAFVARGAAMVSFGREPLSLPSFSGERPFHFGRVVVATQSIWIVGALILMSGMLWWFFEKTFVGKAMRACSQSPFGAKIVGIEVNRIALISFVTSAMLGAIAGVLVAPLNFVSYDDGLNISIKGFIAAVLGGFGSYPGAVLGGVVLGLAEALGAAFISSEFKDAISFAVLLILLLIRPQGLLQR